MSRTISSDGLRRIAAWAGVAFVCVVSSMVARSAHRTFVDENVHVPQIQYFLDGRWIVHPDLTTIPAYHLVMAALVKLTGVGVDGMRILALPFALLGAWAFRLIRVTLGDATATRSALLFFFVPVLFPYYFLIYTDVLSLALLLCALLASLRLRHVTAAVILVAAVLVRQNNVVWSVFIPLLTLWLRIFQGLRDPRREMLPLLSTASPYALPGLVFAGFWIWNGTISLSKTVAPMHPDMTFHVGNVYFALLLYLLLFPAQAWSGMKDFARRARMRPWMLLFPLLVMAFAKVKGSPDNYAFTDYFIRNAMVEHIRQGGWARWLFALATAVAACGLSRTRFLLGQGWLVYVFAVIYLCSSWLIEWRYALVPLTMWMALREGSSARQEFVSLGVWVLLGQFLLWGVFTGRFML